MLSRDLSRRGTRCLEQRVGLLGQKRVFTCHYLYSSLPETGRVNFFLPLPVIKPAPFMSTPLNAIFLLYFLEVIWKCILLK